MVVNPKTGIGNIEKWTNAFIIYMSIDLSPHPIDFGNCPSTYSQSVLGQSAIRTKVGGNMMFSSGIFLRGVAIFSLP